MTAELGIGGAFIPKGAKSIDVAKEFMTYLLKPEVTNGYLKEGLAAGCRRCRLSSRTIRSGRMAIRRLRPTSPRAC